MFSLLNFGTARLLLLAGVCGAAAMWAQGSSLTISYVPPSTGNQVGLQNGDTIPFPQTLVSSQSPNNIVIVNKGGGAVNVQSVSTNGAGFSVTSLPLLPAQLTNNQQLQFSVIFAPTVSGSFHGIVTIVVSGTQYVFGLTGTGASSAYAYQVLSTGGASPVQPNDTIVLPSVAANAVVPAAEASGVAFCVCARADASAICS